nr:MULTISPECIES: group II intron maturase-specific domain-containing protein [unclassified Rhodococcus (in: high G+C Gram-positive bacteria)]
MHCVTERQARKVLAALETRMEQVGLQLHPTKTKIVYCKDRKRRLDYENTSFTFLGYTFRARKAPTRDQASMFSAFLPAASIDARKNMGAVVRSWRLHLRTTTDLEELARWINPVVRGWMNYYGRFYRTEIHAILRRINTYLVRWARRRFKRLRSFKKAQRWWKGLLQRQPGLFAHWKWMTEF